MPKDKEEDMRASSFTKGDRVRFKGGVDTFRVYEAPDDDITLEWEKTGRIFTADYRLLEHAEVTVLETSFPFNAMRDQNGNEYVILTRAEWDKVVERNTELRAALKRIMCHRACPCDDNRKCGIHIDAELALSGDSCGHPVVIGDDTGHRQCASCGAVLMRGSLP